MGKNLSKFDLGMIVAFVLVGVLGGVGWWYTSTMIEEAQQRVSASYSQLQKLAREKITPTQKNIEVLEKNAEELESVLQPIIAQKLLPEKNRLKDIKVMNAVSWKANELFATVERLTRAARNAGIGLPDRFYFSFSKYQAQDPREADTEILGKQLYAIELMTNILIGTGGPPNVRAINSVRRTFDELGKQAIGTIGGQPSTNPEQLPGNVETVADGLYRVYPFEVVFTGRTPGLMAFLNGLSEQPVVFVVRSVEVTNSRLESPKQAELDQILAGGRAGLSNPPAFGAARNQPQKALGPQLIFGEEDIQVTVRVDLVEWLGSPAEVTAGQGQSPERTSPAQKPG